MTEKILACLDHSRFSSSVCDYASWVAIRLKLQLEFLHVLDHHPEAAQRLDLSGSIGLGAQENLLNDLAALDERRATIDLERGRLLLAAAKQRARESGIAEPLLRQRHGELIENLTELQNETSLFVVGKRGEEGERAPAHLGTNLERAVRALHKPLLVVPTTFTVPARVMLAFDGSMTTRKGVEWLAGSALFTSLEIHVVMAGADSPAAVAQLRWARAILEKEGLMTSTALIEGDADKILPGYAVAQKVDLIVMGAYGHSRIRQLLVGSTTTAVIRTSPIPVLLLR
ncbi:universal stress protein UspA [Massilia eurypsychrophila]|jgi:nucleotide-binding universal stress UspA family protein|uniref:Universal stress protein UspA n=1 Tax=Massilia eurypsychrophila TaxID=1485217 RepID=A0A2G8TL76_9BURK|nr:universal stress protein [Massilia eurypsychrophila]PIL46378.1 universal stress protein UspA [Massilia eurypsychrophila]